MERLPKGTPSWMFTVPRESTSTGDKSTVLLFGWMGCKRQHVAKYAQVWAAQGHDVVCIHPPVASCLVPPLIHSAAAQVVRFVAPYAAARGAPVLMHVMSNGGFFCLSSVLKIVRLMIDLKPGGEERHQAAAEGKSGPARQLLDLTKGIVFDCCPGRLTPSSLKAALQGTGLHPLLAAAAAACVRWMLAIVPGMRAGFLGVTAPWLAQGAPRWPALFVYSKADKLIDYTAVEEFASGREAAGAPAERWRLDDAPHVAILRHSPDKYRETLEGFSFRVLPTKKR